MSAKENFAKRIQNIMGRREDGYEVYLYAPIIENLESQPNCIEITRATLMDFYNEYKCILPESITRWENLFY